MTKIEMGAELIAFTMKAENFSPDQKKANIQEILKGIAQGAANTSLSLVAGTTEIPKHLLSEYDIVYNKKSQKFQ